MYFAALANYSTAKHDMSVQDTIKLFPRRKLRDSHDWPVQKGREPLLIRCEDVEELFLMRRCDAAEKLGISTTSLKQICRRLGILRWPYLRSTGTLIPLGRGSKIDEDAEVFTVEQHLSCNLNAGQDGNSMPGYHETNLDKNFYDRDSTNTAFCCTLVRGNSHLPETSLPMEYGLCSLDFRPNLKSGFAGPLSTDLIDNMAVSSTTQAYNQSTCTPSNPQLQATFVCAHTMQINASASVSVELENNESAGNDFTSGTTTRLSPTTEDNAGCDLSWLICGLPDNTMKFCP